MSCGLYLYVFKSALCVAASLCGSNSPTLCRRLPFDCAQGERLGSLSIVVKDSQLSPPAPFVLSLPSAVFPAPCRSCGYIPSPLLCRRLPFDCAQGERLGSLSIVVKDSRLSPPVPFVLSLPSAVCPAPCRSCGTSLARCCVAVYPSTVLRANGWSLVSTLPMGSRYWPAYGVP